MMDANLDYSSVSSFNQIFDSFNLFAGNKIVIFNEFVCPIYKKLSIMLDEEKVLEMLLDLKYN